MVKEQLQDPPYFPAKVSCNAQEQNPAVGLNRLSRKG